MCTNLKTVPKLLRASQVALVVKNPANAARDPDLISGSGRSPEEGIGNPFRHSCLENPTDRGAWLAIVHGVAKSCPHLSNQHFHTFYTTSSISNFYLLADNFIFSSSETPTQVYHFPVDITLALLLFKILFLSRRK